LNQNNVVRSNLPIWTRIIWPEIVYLKERISNQSAGRPLLAKHMAFAALFSQKANETLNFGDSTLGSKQRLGRNATCFPDNDIKYS
jgi:hypothetical protein